MKRSTFSRTRCELPVSNRRTGVDRSPADRSSALVGGTLDDPPRLDDKRRSGLRSPSGPTDDDEVPADGESAIPAVAIRDKCRRPAAPSDVADGCTRAVFFEVVGVDQSWLKNEVIKRESNKNKKLFYQL